jgi:hypothetical protein
MSPRTTATILLPKFCTAPFRLVLGRLTASPFLAENANKLARAGTK